MDEMTEMITLVQTGKIPNNVPIILVNKAFWQPFVTWVKQTVLLEQGYVHAEEMNILQLVDTPEEALAIIRKTSERQFG
jgi:predicted Rossmann-fold nucleotide-binding protein